MWAVSVCFPSRTKCPKLDAQEDKTSVWPSGSAALLSTRSGDRAASESQTRLVRPPHQNSPRGKPSAWLRGQDRTAEAWPGVPASPESPRAAAATGRAWFLPVTWVYGVWPCHQAVGREGEGTARPGTAALSPEGPGVGCNGKGQGSCLNAGEPRAVPQGHTVIEWRGRAVPWKVWDRTPGLVTQLTSHAV